MIVAIGDSITFGQHLDPAQAWPRLLDLDIVPAGVPGDTTRLGLERFPADVQSRGPEKVIIQFGHNDANRWETDRGLPRVSLAAYKANLIEMIDRCRVFGAEPYLCTLTPSLRSEQHATDCELYDRTLRRVADEEDVSLIDVRRPFLQGPTKALLMDDGLHLSVVGHRVYARIVEGALR